ncbi:hypothetical protein ACMFMG_007982 [Clarireedia jacksonii]
MSSSETAPLNPSRDLEAGDPDLDFYNDSINRMETSKQRNGNNSLCFRILYGFSLSASFSGLVILMLAYITILKAPFDKRSKQSERESYESKFLGMQSIVVFLSVNTLYTALNLYMARKGRLELLAVLNMPYDLCIFAALIGFGILELIQVLWDRRLCDGWEDSDMYNKCDSVMFYLLVVEIAAISFGLLVGVLHFILLVTRCATWNSVEMRMRMIEQEEVLLVLLERRKRLMEENELLEARRLAAERPLPPLPREVENYTVTSRERDDRRVDGYLIDIAAEAPINGEEGAAAGDSDFTPFISDTGASARNEAISNSDSEVHGS